MRQVHIVLASVILALCALPLAAAGCSGRLTTISGADDGGEGGATEAGGGDSGRPRQDAAPHDATVHHDAGDGGGRMDGAGTTEGGGTDGAGATDSGGTDGAGAVDGGDGGDSGGMDACVGLECQQTCATTTVTGKVYDPAGLDGLYNVFVYVPNAPLAALPSGPGATCTACQAPASGSPIASTTTLADGTFQLTNVPEGKNIPIVLQLGKWRRHLTIPSVAKCVTTTPADGFFRFPRKQGETSPDDNIPLIALTTGCESTECFLESRIGIDSSEFTASTGTGRVHVYRSTSDNGSTYPGVPAGSPGADVLWSTSSEWLLYDMVIDACECASYDRGGSGSTDIGYKNFLAYLDAGGRALMTHYMYNFYASAKECGGSYGSCSGQAPLPKIAAWEGNAGLPFAPASDCPKDASLYGGGSCLLIDSTPPKGAALSTWYSTYSPGLSVGGGEMTGYVGVTDIRMDVGGLEASLVTAGKAVPWLYAGSLSSSYDTYTLGVNAPPGNKPAKQCGRAVYSDLHLEGTTSGNFPTYCSANPNTDDHAPNQLAAEFLFFDLASCVQDETLAPISPPTL